MTESTDTSFKPYILTDKDIFNDRFGILNYKNPSSNMPWYQPYTKGCIIYNDDCLHVIENLIANGRQVDLTVTSPPYDNLRTYSNNSEFNFETFKKICKALYDVTKDGGVCVWVVNDATIKGGESGTSFRQVLYFMEVGWKLYDTMIYQKHNPVPNTGGGKRYQQAFEYMFVFSKGKPNTTNILTEPRHNLCNDKRTHRIKTVNRDKDGVFSEPKLYEYKEMVPRRNVWTYKVGLYNSTSDKEAFKHPAIFPEKLAEDHILSWSKPYDIVFDPFLGSGTVGKMALLNDRCFIGCDINEEYCKIAKERIEKYIGNDRCILQK